MQQAVKGSLRDETQIVYVSPLKALSNDIQRNLEAPLAGIRGALHRLGLPDAAIRTFVRTGDTPQIDRTRMRKKPPHIVVTTPESLYILLGSEVRAWHAEDDADRDRRRNSCLGVQQAGLASRSFS